MLSLGFHDLNYCQKSVKVVTKKCKRSADLLSVNKCTVSVKKVLHLKCTYGRSGYPTDPCFRHVYEADSASVS